MWFKSDDKFPFHPKTMQASLEAIGLWGLAGPWSTGNGTDGFVPRHAVMVLSRGKPELADELVTVGLWALPEDGRDGYVFHDFGEYNPLREDVDRRREEDKKRKAEWRSRKNASQPTAQHSPPDVTPDVTGDETCDSAAPDTSVPEESQRTSDVTPRRVFSYPTRPDPTRPGLPTGVPGGAGGEAEEPAASSTPRPASRKRSARNDGHPIPDDWWPTTGDQAWFTENCPNLRGQGRELTGEFKNYWESKPGKDCRKLDWSKTWRGWMSKENRGAAGRGRARSNGGKPLTTDVLRNGMALADRYREQEAAEEREQEASVHQFPVRGAG